MSEKIVERIITLGIFVVAVAAFLYILQSDLSVTRQVIGLVFLVAAWGTAVVMNMEDTDEKEQGK